ncbi:MAG: GNAT family N-acetyltransferase [Proteobacteria bacterium]|nr:GNAT family N-acetyltransferase [Pseudomonadota bacterium]
MTTSARSLRSTSRRLAPTQQSPDQFEVRLAENAGEVEAAQRLRYRVFYEEMAAQPRPEVAAERRDWDHFDSHCEHLVIIDRRAGSPDGKVVGTYRLLRREAAAKLGGFYTETEFDIAPLLAYPGEILELGRSCVEVDYRTRAVMHHLWRGIAEYVLRNDIKLMFGCASLPGTDAAALAGALSYLHHYHLAPPALRARALEDRYVSMALLSPAEIDPGTEIAVFDDRAAVAALPPLIKGYLRVGGFVGDGAVIDHAFNTTDVCVIVATDRVTEKYFRHYLRTEPA